MSDKQVHLADFLKTGRMPAADVETEEGLPATNAEYRPFSRRSNKPEFSLHFITAAGTIRSVQYAHLDSGSSYTAECLTLRFMGMEPLKVVIHGRVLRDLIRLHPSAPHRLRAQKRHGGMRPMTNRS